MGAAAVHAKPPKASLSDARRLHAIINDVLRLAKSAGAEEAEVHVDEVLDDLTRFANNAIHQNVSEHGITVSIRTVAESRTARVTTNRIDENSLRAAIDSALSLTASQPKDKQLLALPSKQRYRSVQRFIKQTAAITPEDRARAVRRACDLAVQQGRWLPGFFPREHRNLRWAIPAVC
jgi:predicted Zn-dependent protease